MNVPLVLLPGWSFAAAALEPLAEVLGRRLPGLCVRLAELPALAEADAWLDELDARLPADAALGGWSLGGMLAAQLAARRGLRCPALVTLASNASFPTRADWPAAMPAETLNAFCAAFADKPEATLQRFALLCAQGSAEGRPLSRRLAGLRSELPLPALAAGLEWLQRLDNREALQSYAGPQWHLLAERDALVPAAAAEALRQCQPAACVETLAEVGHALALESPAAVAARLAEWLEAQA